MAGETGLTPVWPGLRSSETEATLRKTTLLLSFGVLTLLIPSATLHAAPILTNGSFDTVGASTSFYVQGNDARLAGWTSAATTQIWTCLVQPGQGPVNACGATSPSIFFWGGSAFPATSPDGGNFMAIDGDAGFGRPISQTVTGLTVGMPTDISFWQGAAQQRCPLCGDGTGFTGATTERWRVTLGSETHFSTLMNNASHGFVDWNYQTLQFTPTATSAVLTFFAEGTPNGLPPFVLLDGVSVTQAPEPAAGVLVLAALVGMAVVRTRRRG